MLCLCALDARMQSTNSEYGSPYLAACHVTFLNVEKSIKIIIVYAFLTFSFVKDVSPDVAVPVTHMEHGLITGHINSTQRRQEFMLR